MRISASASVLALASLAAVPAVAQEIRVGQVDPLVRFSDGTLSLLVSQIGYAIPGVRDAYLLAPTRAEGEAITEYRVEDAAGDLVASGVPVHAGEWLSGHFFRLDLSAIELPGEYRICAGDLVSHAFPVGSPRSIWFDPLVADMTLGQLAVRRRDDALGGYVDSGNDIRETNSHVTMLNGLLDVLETHGAWLDAPTLSALGEHVDHLREFIESQIDADGRIRGGYYLGTPIEDGRWPNHLRGVWGILRLARYVTNSDPILRGLLLDEAWRGLDYARDELGLKGRSAFLLMRLLVEADFHLQTDDAAALAEVRVLTLELRVRQLKAYEPTAGGLYGLFRTKRGGGDLERLDLHDTGETTGENWALPMWRLADLLEAHPSDSTAPTWRALVRDFVFGFVVPASRRSPLGLAANGDYDGVRWFSDLYHGINGTYAHLARGLVRYADVVGEPELVDLAERQLLWIAGLNTGHRFPRGSEPFSAIVGHGYQWLHDGHGALNGVTGSVVNGMSATPQFVKGMPAGEERPSYLCDESWVSHVGGFLSAVSELMCGRLRQGPLYLVPEAADVIARWDELPGAERYVVYRDEDPSGRFADVAATAGSGPGRTVLPVAGEQLVFYRLAAGGGACEGPH